MHPRVHYFFCSYMNCVYITVFMLTYREMMRVSRVDSGAGVQVRGQYARQRGGGAGDTPGTGQLPM